MSTQKEKIIVLKKTKYSEADLILQVLTSKGARLSLLARGALKSKKRFAGGILEPTHHLEVVYNQKPNAHIFTLEEASLLHSFDRLRLDYDRLSLALEFLEWVEKTSQEGEMHAEGLYNLLGQGLTALQDETDYVIFKLRFALKFLFQQGMLQPEPWMQKLLEKGIHQKLALTDVERLAVLEHQEEVKYQIGIFTKHGHF